MNPVCLFVCFSHWSRPFFKIFLYLITLVLEKEKLAVCFMISFFPTFCLFRFPLSIFIQRYCTCMLPHVCLPPSADPLLPPAGTDQRTRVANTSTRIQTAALFLRRFLGLFRLFLLSSYRRAFDSFDLANYKIRIPPVKVDQISSFIWCVLRAQLCHHFPSARPHVRTMQMRRGVGGARLVRSAQNLFSACRRSFRSQEWTGCRLKAPLMLGVSNTNQSVFAWKGLEHVAVQRTRCRIC